MPRRSSIDCIACSVNGALRSVTFSVVSSAATMSGNRTVTVSANTLHVDGVIGDNSNGYSLTKAGANDLLPFGWIWVDACDDAHREEPMATISVQLSFGLSSRVFVFLASLALLARKSSSSSSAQTPLGRGGVGEVGDDLAVVAVHDESGEEGECCAADHDVRRGCRHARLAREQRGA